MNYTETYGTGPAVNPQQLMDALNTVRRDVSQLVDQARSNYAGLNSELHRIAEERPLVLLGAAFGAGFVLGGGLFSRFVLGLAATAVRSSLMRSLPSMIMNQVAAYSDQQGYGEGQPGRPGAQH
jgi:hypothetical protein